MSQIITPKIRCPLCREAMAERRVQARLKSGRPHIAKVYFCRPCEIGTYDFDPAFNRWDDTDKKIPCPNCGFDAIKWFARFLDGFFKGVCPRCKSVIKDEGDVRFDKKDGSIIIPDHMEKKDPGGITELKIPIDKLEKKIGKERANALRKKIRGKKRPE